MIVPAEVDKQINALLRGVPALVAYCTGGIHNQVAPAEVTGPHCVWTTWAGDGNHHSIGTGPEHRIWSSPRVDVKIIVPGPSYSAAVGPLAAADAAMESAGWRQAAPIHYRETTAGGPAWWHLGGEYHAFLVT